jgi:hypothetical protein
MATGSSVATREYVHKLELPRNVQPDAAIKSELFTDKNDDEPLSH